MTHEHRKDVHNVPRVADQNFGTFRLRDQPDRALSVLRQCDSAELSYFVQQVVRMGYCVAFSATSDGGAISITCYDGATKFKGYVRAAHEFETRYRDLLSAIRGEE